MYKWSGIGVVISECVKMERYWSGFGVNVYNMSGIGVV